MTSIVLTVCEEFGISPARFFGAGRNGKVTRARRAAILRLIEAGLDGSGIAAATKLSLSTVDYWRNEGYRERRMTAMREAARAKARAKRNGHLHHAEAPSPALPAQPDSPSQIVGKTGAAAVDPQG